MQVFTSNLTTLRPVSGFMRIFAHVKLERNNLFQESMKGERDIPHVGLIHKVTALKLFLDIVSSPPTETC